jgi:hypothetical protein
MTAAASPNGPRYHAAHGPARSPVPCGTLQPALPKRLSGRNPKATTRRTPDPKAAEERALQLGSTSHDNRSHRDHTRTRAAWTTHLMTNHHECNESTLPLDRSPLALSTRFRLVRATRSDSATKRTLMPSSPRFAHPTALDRATLETTPRNPAEARHLERRATARQAEPSRTLRLLVSLVLRHRGGVAP